MDRGPCAPQLSPALNVTCSSSLPSTFRAQGGGTAQAGTQLPHLLPVVHASPFKMPF